MSSISPALNLLPDLADRADRLGWASPRPPQRLGSNTQVCLANDWAGRARPAFGISLASFCNPEPRWPTSGLPAQMKGREPEALELATAEPHTLRC